MKNKKYNNEVGAGLVEYALLTALIAVMSFSSVETVFQQLGGEGGMMYKQGIEIAAAGTSSSFNAGNNFGCGDLGNPCEEEEEE